MNLKNNLLTVRWTLTFIIGTIWSVFSCQAINPPFVIKHLGDGQSIVQIENQKKFLLLPVEEASPEAKLYMIADNDVVRNMNVRLAINKVDYFVPVDLSGFDNKSLSFNFQLIPDTAICWDEMKLSDEFDTTNRENFRPLYHFTPQYGWMNDPNGLVYAEGVYHLYFQHNPFDVQWENMSWGHAVSRDLLHWEQKDDVLFPDETGTMFSGSGIVNDRKMLGLPEDALVFFYTAAGNNNKWSAGKQFTQRIAYSTDGGETLHKIDKSVLPTVCKENRDPKVFWHEKSGAYIMTLWLEENDFGIFRSTDLLNWEQTDRLTFKEAWECPDLVCLKDEKGNETWMFWSADGFYFWGEFDGYQFQTDGVRHAAYINKIAYAAQTYSNTGNRVISVPWLRFPNRGRNYTGAMGLPREFSVAYKNGEKVLRQEPVREYEDSRKPVYDNTMKNVRQQDTENEAPMADTVAKVADEHVSAKDLFQWKFAPDTATEIQITRAESEDILSACINQKTDFVYNAKTGELKIGEETFATGVGIRDFSLLFDDVILEVTADCGTITGIFELPEIAEKFCMEKGSIEKIQVFGEEVWQP